MLNDFRGKTRSLFRDKTFRKALLVFILAKIIILSAAYAALYLPDVQHRRMRSDNAYINGWAQYDAGGYMDIAENGFNHDFNGGIGNYSLYPFYPALIKLFSLFGFFDYAIVAFLIANVASFLVLVVIYLLVKEELGKRASFRTLFYLMLFPTAYFLTAMYSESLFILLAASMFLFARREKWLYVGLLGFCLSLTRIQGVLMFFPMAYMYMRTRAFSLRKIDYRALCLLLIPLGVGLFFLYEYSLTGDLFIQFKEYSAFNKQIAYPWVTLYETVVAVMGGSVYYTINLAAFAMLLGLAVLSLRRLKREYSIYMFLNVFFVLLSSNLNGIGRYVLIMFPAFMVLAALSEKNNRVAYLLYAIYSIAVILLVLFTLRHVNEGIYLTLQTF